MSLSAISSHPINADSVFSLLPKALIQLVFKHLNPEQLLRICRVCSMFNHVASCNPLWNSYDIREVFPNATFIDRRVWEAYVDVEKKEYGLTLESKGRPCVDKIDYLVLKRMESKVEGKKGFTIMELFKGDKLNNVKGFAESPKAGNRTQFSRFEPSIIEELGDEELPERIFVAITNDVFEKSGGKFTFEQKQIAKDLGCEVPGIDAVTNLAIMSFIISPKDSPVRLFGSRPMTYTLCVNQKQDEAGEIVEIFSDFGNFTSEGPEVRRYWNQYSRDLACYGVAGLKKLKIIES